MCVILTINSKAFSLIDVLNVYIKKLIYLVRLVVVLGSNIVQRSIWKFIFSCVGGMIHYWKYLVLFSFLDLICVLCTVLELEILQF